MLECAVPSTCISIPLECTVSTTSTSPSRECEVSASCICKNEVSVPCIPMYLECYCYPVSGVYAVCIVYTFSYIVMYGVCCFVLSIVTLKGMIKFAAFLLVGNSVNLIGISLYIPLATFTPWPLGEDYQTFLLVTAFNYVNNLLTLLIGNSIQLY